MALDGSTGRLLSTLNLTNTSSDTLEAVGDGSDGYFTLTTFVTPRSSHTLQLYRLLPDGTLHQTSANATALVNAALHSQPALRHETTGNCTQLVARDLASNDIEWSSGDAFLVGTDWGANATYIQLDTAYQRIDGMPGGFLVINTAYAANLPGNTTTVVAQAAIFQLSTGKQITRSPLLTFPRLNHTVSNPSTWQFDDVLLLRGDSVWYTLSLPQLMLVQQGHYATPDAWVASNNWLVDADGSYIALDYSSDDGLRGYPPYTSSSSASASQRRPAESLHQRCMEGE